MGRRFTAGWMALVVLPVYAPGLLAQAPAVIPDATAPPPRVALQKWAPISTAAEERGRLEQLFGTEPTEGYLLRSTGSRLRLPADSAAGIQLRVLLPTASAIWNSRIPYSLNDGALWAGRGLSGSLTGGVHAWLGPVRLVLAPEVRFEQNGDFEFVPYSGSDRSPYAARWHWSSLPISIDLPTRFGPGSRTYLGIGQSSMAVEAGPVEAGWAADDQWWGPGIRNAIVLSNNAGGIPRIYLRTARPIEIGIGALEMRWFAGTLRESAYFDTIPRNDRRQISGVALTFNPAIEPGLTVGVARTQSSRLSGMDDFPGRMFGALWRTGRREEQISSLFARWVFPSVGFEAYGEWARHRLTSSLREFLIAPNHTQGYTAGVQWARPLTADRTRTLRLQSELTYLEQSTTTRHRPNGSFYTSARLPQGYTQRGQVIGAAIGPGASSQFAAADYLSRSWWMGAFAGRIRWDNDAYYLTQEPYPLDHDVSVLAGLRGGVAMSVARLDVELTHAKRYNFMFQSDARFFGQSSAWDLRNTTLNLRLTPDLPDLRR